MTNAEIIETAALIHAADKPAPVDNMKARMAALDDGLDALLIAENGVS
jgi:hypothetical protein